MGRFPDSDYLPVSQVKNQAMKYQNCSIYASAMRLKDLEYASKKTKI